MNTPGKHRYYSITPVLPELWISTRGRKVHVHHEVVYEGFSLGRAKEQVQLGTSFLLQICGNTHCSKCQQILLTDSLVKLISVHGQVETAHISVCYFIAVQSGSFL